MSALAALIVALVLSLGPKPPHATPLGQNPCLDAGRTYYCEVVP